MFEKEIKFIVDYTLNKLRKEVAHVNIGRLLNSSVHPAIIKYCSAEIDNQIKGDRNKLLTNSFFDYSGSNVSKYFNLISDEIKQNYKMKGDDLKRLIIKAVSFNANYVVRPGWTLAKFIFNQEKERTIKDVLSYFNYIYYYDYQIKVLSAFIQKRKLDSLTREEFIMLTSKIDREVISSNKKEILKDGVISIADFFNEGGMTKDKVAPFLLEYYLKDKKFVEASDALRTSYGADDKQKQPVKDILSKLSAFIKEEIEVPEIKPVPMVSEVQNNNEEEEPVKPYSIEQNKEDVSEGIRIIPASQKEDYQSTLQSLLHFTNGQKESAPPVPDEPEYEIEMEEEKEQESEPVTLSSEPESEPESEPGPESESESEPEGKTHNQMEIIEEDIPVRNDREGNEEFAFKYYIKEEKPAELPSNGKKKSDIFDILSKRETDRITAALFNDDENEFVSIMDKIIECNSYDDASIIMKKVFQVNKINPYSKDAILFTTAVANFFNQE